MGKNGWLSTNSPGVSTHTLPLSFHTSIAAPSILHCISPGTTGKSGWPPTKAVHTSVPPLKDIICVDGNRCCKSLQTAADNGEPVAPRVRINEKSCSSTYGVGDAI